ncbi:MAG: LPS assembly protein LptD, partial [Rhizobacter sp.]
IRYFAITDTGVPLTQHLSDILLLGSASIVPRWSVDGTLQYSPQLHQTVRTVTNLRYSPTAWRTFSVSYRYTQGLLRQVDLGWQWPIAGPAVHERDIDAARRERHGDSTCSGSWYAVGHTSYSLRDRRLVNSIAGFEYDAGCWIGRVVAERVSTGAQQSTMRLMFQLELVGLSRLGSSPLKVLRDNIPGYRLLRDENQDALTGSSSSTLYPFDDE